MKTLTYYTIVGGWRNPSDTDADLGTYVLDNRLYTTKEQAIKEVEEFVKSVNAEAEKNGDPERWEHQFITNKDQWVKFEEGERHMGVIDSIEVVELHGEEKLYWSLEHDMIKKRAEIFAGFGNGEIKTFEDAIRCGMNSVRIMNGEWGHLATGYMDEQGEIIVDISDTEMTREELLALPVVEDDPLFDQDEDGYTFMSVIVREEKNDK